jgi:hypothetical protein
MYVRLFQLLYSSNSRQAEQRSQSCWLGFELDDQGKLFDSWQHHQIVLFSKTSMPAVESTQPPTQRDTGESFHGAKEADA